MSDDPTTRARALEVMGEADLEAARRARQLAKDDHPMQPPEP